MSNPAAWHPDPLKRHELRYWDGERWTEHVSDAQVVSTDPLDAEPAVGTGTITMASAVEDTESDVAVGTPRVAPEPTAGDRPPAAPVAAAVPGARNRPSGIALVFGILSLVAIIPVIGVVLGAPIASIAIAFGVIGLLVAKRTGQGKGRSIAGIVLGAVALALVTAQILIAQRLTVGLEGLDPDDVQGFIESLLSGLTGVS